MQVVINMELGRTTNDAGLAFNRVVALISILARLHVIHVLGINVKLLHFWLIAFQVWRAEQLLLGRPTMHDIMLFQSLSETEYRNPVGIQRMSKSIKSKRPCLLQTSATPYHANAMWCSNH